MHNTINNTNFIYTAGYIDGDGCFYIGRYTDKKRNLIRYQHKIVISSTNAELLKEFAKEFKGSFRKVNEKHIPKGHKPQYQFILSSNKNSSEFIENIKHFLVEKKQQAEIYYKFINTKCKDTKDQLIEDMKKTKHDQHTIEKTHINILLKNRLTVIPKTIDYIYLSGFIDSECCLSINKYKPKNRKNYYYKIFLTCNNTKFPSIYWIMKRFGGQARFVSRKLDNDLHRDQVCWMISSKSLSIILPCILPYLRYKKPVCEELIKLYAIAFKKGGVRRSKEFRNSTPKIIEERERIFHNIRSLNKKGT